MSGLFYFHALSCVLSGMFVGGVCWLLLRPCPPDCLADLPLCVLLPSRTGNHTHLAGGYILRNRWCQLVHFALLPYGRFLDRGGKTKERGAVRARKLNQQQRPPIMVPFNEDSSLQRRRECWNLGSRWSQPSDTARHYYHVLLAIIFFFIAQLITCAWDQPFWTYEVDFPGQIVAMVFVWLTMWTVQGVFFNPGEGPERFYHRYLRAPVSLDKF